MNNLFKPLIIGIFALAMFSSSAFAEGGAKFKFGNSLVSAGATLGLYKVCKETLGIDDRYGCYVFSFIFVQVSGALLTSMGNTHQSDAELGSSLGSNALGGLSAGGAIIIFKW